MATSILRLPSQNAFMLLDASKTNKMCVFASASTEASSRCACTALVVTSKHTTAPIAHRQ